MICSRNRCTNTRSRTRSTIGTCCAFTLTTYKPGQEEAPKAGGSVPKRAVVDAFLAKHDAATGGRKFNAIFATASINDAIEYYHIFKAAQADKR